MELLDHTPFLVPRNCKENYPNYVYYPQAFTPVECKRIVELGLARGTHQAKIGDDGGEENLEYRNSRMAWIENSKDTNWIFQRLADVAVAANNEYFNYDLVGLVERLQFTEYKQGQFYNWHTDDGSGILCFRKLSIVINLTHEMSYSGGELQIFSERGNQIPNGLGGAIVFPSFKEHRVTGVKEGTRHTLVTWVNGPPFR